MLTFINALDERVEFGYKDPIWLVSFESKGGTDVQVQNAPYQDGSFYIDTRLETEFITLEIEMFDPVDISIQRTRLSKILNPKLGPGRLIYDNKGTQKEITVISEKRPDYPVGRGNVTPYSQKALVHFEAMDPYWRDPHETARGLHAYVGNFTLPFTLPFELGVSGDRTILVNKGDVPAPVSIDIRGPTTNPQVINRTNGKYIRVNRAIASDEILHINTTPGQKRVEIYRGNNTIEQAFGYLDHNSDLFMLEVGENEIEHIADAGDGRAVVAVTWQNRYSSI